MNRIRFFIIVSLAFVLLLLPALAQEDTQTHIVQPGENLFRIALRYGVDMNQLAQANGITDPARIYVGQVLTIPGLPEPTGTVAENPLVASAPIIHIVQRGEYLKLIADKYGVSIQDIQQANQLSSSTIYPGQRLQIWTSTGAQDFAAVEATPEATEPVTAAPESTEPALSTPEVESTESVAATPEATESAQAAQPIIHVVAPGEYLTQIANAYGVSWEAIAEANNISNPNQIYTGMALTIPGTIAQQKTLDPSVPRIDEAQADIPDPGPHWGTGREIVVDLSTQMTYAYEDGKLVFSALVSTGLPGTPTVTGEFAIYNRFASQTMTGPGYYLPNVQWVQYFYSGYALHGTYWHHNYGHPMSHGCVNLTNDDAQWLYNFADIGTPVYVQY